MNHIGTSPSYKTVGGPFLFIRLIEILLDRNRNRNVINITPLASSASLFSPLVSDNCKLQGCQYHFDATPIPNSQSCTASPIDFRTWRKFYEPISISDTSALCTPASPPPRASAPLRFSPSLSPSLPRYLWLRLCSYKQQHPGIASGWLNTRYRRHVGGARRGKGDPCYQVVVACFYNSHRVIRLEWRGG